jgi:signal transduction histidine kinase
MRKQIALNFSSSGSEQITQATAVNLEGPHQMRQKRDRLLESTAKATNALLTLENLDEAVNTALSLIGEGIGCDIVVVHENVFESASRLPSSCNFIYEWVAPGFRHIAANFSSTSLSAEFLGFAFLEQYFLEGDGFGGFVDVWNEPLRSLFVSLQIQSAYSVPIRVNGQWWGILCLEYCQTPTQISAAEVSVLMTIADCIGSVIQRDRLQQEQQQAAQQRTADLEAYNQVLRGRDRLLEVTARAANVLLTQGSIDVAMNTALTILIEGTGCDRLEVLENVYESSSPMPIRYLDTIRKCLDPKFEIIRDGIGPADAAILSNAFRKYFLDMDGFGGLVEEWDEPLRSWLANIQIQSTYAVPIRVNGQWWGILCFDYCRASIQFSPAEVAVLRTMADCIGSAIQRDRLQQERQQGTQQRTADLEAYNQVLRGRDRLLEASAKAANVLLTVANFDEAIMTAFEIIGKGMGCDRLNMLENSFDPASPLPIRFNYIYEWAMPDFVRSSAQLKAAAILANQLDAQFVENYFLNGDGFGGLLDVWPEPLRNSPTADQVQSAYSVPIRVNGQWWGVLSFHYCRAAIEISPAEVSVLMTISDCIGSAIQRDRTQKILLQAEQSRVAELVKANTALKQSLDILAADSDLDRFIGNTLKLIAQQFDSQLIEYWVYPQPEGQGYIHLTYWEGQLLSASNTSISHASASGMVPFLDIPLSIGDTNIGVLAIYLSAHRTFSGQTVELAHALAQQLTLAVELSRLAEEAQQAALLQERTRMAREIHDTLAQAFGGILMQLQAATYFAPTQPEQAQTHLLNAQALAQEGLTEARRSVWNLYLDAAEYEDLARAIAKFIEQTPSSQSVSINLTIDGTPYRLHPDLGLNLLRIAQESITNALRHARAQSIQIYLSYSLRTLQLSIRDDGCGFEPQSPTRGFGLLGMQQRAARIGATWHLTSQPEQGTTITVTLPYSQAR